MLERLLDMLFPEHCISCGKKGSALCAICERRITTHPRALSATTATLFDYRNPTVKKAIWALKYHRRKALGAYFGTALYREFFKQLAHGHHAHEEIMIVPIPASEKAVTTRGYNHAGEIGKVIVKAGVADGLPLRYCPDLLKKQREIVPQARTKGRAARMHNVEDSFVVRNGARVTGKTVILIDDVITTGATVSEARRVIRAYHPKRVLAIAAAH